MQVDGIPCDFPRPFVNATIHLSVPCTLLAEFILQLEHSLQVSCLVSPAIIYALRLTSKFGDVEAFDRYYAAKAGAGSVPHDPRRIQCFLYTQRLLGYVTQSHVCVCNNILLVKS